MSDLEISLRYHLSKYKKERVKFSSGAEGEFSDTIEKLTSSERYHELIKQY